MKWLLVALATVLLAGCAVVPAPYPYSAVPESNFGVGAPAYRRGYHYYYDAYGRPYYGRRYYYGYRYYPGY